MDSIEPTSANIATYVIDGPNCITNGCRRWGDMNAQPTAGMYTLTVVPRFTSEEISIQPL